MTARGIALVRPVALADLVALTKPRITLLVLVTALGGMWLGDHPPFGVMLSMLVGTGLVVSGANTLNMFLERDIDGRMERTRDRPLPAGRLRPEVALVFGLTLSAIAVPLLGLLVNWLTGLLALLSFGAYVAVYTPLKQRSWLALLIGAVPGAMPPLMGWAAARGRIEGPGLILFAILFFWQVPHFLAITLYRADDYARAGFKVLVAERGLGTAKRHATVFLAGLVATSLLLGTSGLVQRGFGGAAIGLSLALFAVGLAGLAPSAGERWARRLFIASLVYLALLFAVLVLGSVAGAARA